MPVVVRRLDDDLVRADSVHAEERSVPMLSDLAHPFERRELVRHAPNRPARSVWPAAIPIREDLRRRHRLVALAERAALVGRSIFRVAGGAGPFGPARLPTPPGR